MATINKILLSLCIISTIGVIYIFLNDNNLKSKAPVPLNEITLATTTEIEQPIAISTTTIDEMDPSYEIPTLSIQKTGRIGSVLITPLKVLEDSRCPIDVQCIQAGKVLVNTNIKSALGVYSNIFIEGEPFTTESEIITLIDVLPKPLSGVKIKNSDYQFIFSVTPQEVVYKNTSAAKIIVESPMPLSAIDNEFKILGKAVGGWFFEASSRVRIIDMDGNIIFSGIAKPTISALTSDLVPFTAEIKLPNPYIGPARIILANDNPSGLPENESSISFPVVIK